MKAPKPSRPSSRAIVTKKTSEAALATISPPRRTSALRRSAATPRRSRRHRPRVGVDYALGVTSLAGSRRFAPRPSLPEAAPAAVLGVLLALAASAAVAGGLGAAGPSLWPSVAAGVGAPGRARARDLALRRGRRPRASCCSGVVRIEPAPVDGVMAIVMAVALVTGRFDLRSAPLWASGLVGVFLAFNLLACVEAMKPGRAACS